MGYNQAAMAKRLSDFRTLTLVLVLISLVGASCRRSTAPSVPAVPTPISTVPELESQAKINLTIDFGGGEIATYSAAPRQVMTVYDLLVEAAGNFDYPVDTQVFDFGLFVKGIGGWGNTTDRAWIYFVNGKSGQVAADQAEVRPGDRVEWRYVKPE